MVAIAPVAAGSNVASRHFTATASVTPLTGESAYGPLFGPPVTVACWPEQSNRQVRTSSGEEVTSGTRLWTDAANDHLFPVGSAVVFRGEQTEVVAVALHDPGALSLPPLLEVTLL